MMFYIITNYARSITFGVKAEVNINMSFNLFSMLPFALKTAGLKLHEVQEFN